MASKAAQKNITTQFMTITGVNEKMAQRMLKQSSWKLEQAMDREPGFGLEIGRDINMDDNPQRRANIRTSNTRASNTKEDRGQSEEKARRERSGETRDRINARNGADQTPQLIHRGSVLLPEGSTLHQIGRGVIPPIFDSPSFSPRLSVQDTAQRASSPRSGLLAFLPELPRLRIMNGPFIPYQPRSRFSKFFLPSHEVADDTSGVTHGRRTSGQPSPSNVGAGDDAGVAARNGQQISSQSLPSNLSPLASSNEPAGDTSGVAATNGKHTSRSPSDSSPGPSSIEATGDASSETTYGQHTSPESLPLELSSLDRSNETARDISRETTKMEPASHKPLPLSSNLSTSSHVPASDTSGAMTNWPALPPSSMSPSQIADGKWPPNMLDPVSSRTMVLDFHPSTPSDSAYGAEGAKEPNGANGANGRNGHSSHGKGNRFEALSQASNSNNTTSSNTANGHTSSGMGKRHNASSEPSNMRHSTSSNTANGHTSRARRNMHGASSQPSPSSDGNVISSRDPTQSDTPVLEGVVWKFHWAFLPEITMEPSAFPDYHYYHKTIPWKNLPKLAAKKENVRVNQYIADSQGYSYYAQTGSVPTPKDNGGLAKLFEKYREPSDEVDKTGVNGTMRYLQDLGLNLENAEILVPLEIVQAPALAEMSKEGFIEGWKALGCDTIAKQKNHIKGQLAYMSVDMALLKRVYRYTFVCSKEQGAKALPLENALVYWEMLFSPPGKPWVTENANWTELWINYLKANWTKTVNKDMWNQTFEFFLKTMADETLSFWSEESAWPGVIDDFVAYAKEKRGDVPDTMETD